MIEGACPACSGTFSNRAHLGISLPRCEGCGLFAADADTLQSLARRLRKANETEAADLRREMETAREMLPRVTQGCPHCNGTLLALLRHPWVACEECGLRLVPVSCFEQLVADPFLANAGPVGARGRLPKGQESPRAILLGGGILSILAAAGSVVLYFEMPSHRQSATSQVLMAPTGSSSSHDLNTGFLTAAALMLALGVGLLIRAFKRRGDGAESTEDAQPPEG